MKILFCRCGDPVIQKAYDESRLMNADAFRCQTCLDIWKESARRQPKKTLTVTTESVLVVRGNTVNSSSTPEIVEACAYEGLTTVAAAKRVGVTVGTFMNYIYSKDHAYKKAWRTGKDRRKAELSEVKS